MIFFDVPLLYFSVQINESKEKFRIFFVILKTMIKNVVAPLSSSNFPRKLIC